MVTPIVERSDGENRIPPSPETVSAEEIEAMLAEAKRLDDFFQKASGRPSTESPE
jgi:hypothetical protein